MNKKKRTRKKKPDVPRRAEPLKAFCRSVGISYDSGRRAIADGKLRIFRFGNLILVPAEEIERVTREGL